MIITKTITINAPPEKVWRVFSEPEITRKMGGEYITDWRAGSSIGWKGKEGNVYTKGTILQVEPANLLQHNLMDMQDRKLLSIITYRFAAQNEQTILEAEENICYETDLEQLAAIAEGWDYTLQAVKNIAEGL